MEVEDPEEGQGGSISAGREDSRPSPSPFPFLGADVSVAASECGFALNAVMLSQRALRRGTLRLSCFESLFFAKLATLIAELEREKPKRSKRCGG